MPPVRIYAILLVAVVGAWLALHWTPWLWSLVGAAMVWAWWAMRELRRIDQANRRTEEAELRVLEETAQRARLENDLRRAEIATAYTRRLWIPEGYIGAKLQEPDEIGLYFPWTYKQEVSPAVVKIQEEATPLEPLAPSLPGPIDLFTVLATFQPSTERILLALGLDGPITCSLKALSHVALAAATGGGKSSIVRMLLGQLAALGQTLYLADPHYTPQDPESGEDWRPIAAHLAEPPITRPAAIATFARSLVAEMRRRYALREQGQRWDGGIIYSVIEELPAILAQLEKDQRQQLVKDYSTLLREARKVGIYLIAVSQDWLVDTIGAESGEIRSNLLTAFYGGGGLGTARAILDPHVKLPEDLPLGKGVVLLRNVEAQPSPAPARVPYASNEALYRLLPAPAEVPELKPLPLRLSLSAEDPAKEEPARLPTAAEAERERINAAIDAHPNWSATKIAQSLDLRNNNKISLVAALMEEKQAGGKSA